MWFEMVDAVPISDSSSKFGYPMECDRQFPREFNSPSAGRWVLWNEFLTQIFVWWMKTQFKRLFYFALFACLFLSCHNLSFFYQHIDCINLKFDAFCFASSVSLENNWSKFNLEIIRLFLFSVNCSNCHNRNVLNSVQMRSYWLHGKFFSLNLRKKKCLQKPKNLS